MKKEYSNENTEMLTGLVDIKEIKKAKQKSEKKKTKKKKEIKKEKKKMAKWKKVLIIISSIIVFLFCSALFLLYGPISFFRETLITTAMTTLNHQYLATWFYDDETIKAVLEKNKIISIDDTSNTDDIYIKEYGDDYTNYKNEYEKQILQRDKDEKLYKVIEIKGSTYKGYLVAVYDPSKVTIAHTKYLGSQGQLITELAEENDAVVAINGGGFYDPDRVSQGGIPIGLTVSDGEIIYNYNDTKKSNLIGLTYDNKLILGSMSASDIEKNNIRDAIQFGPFLIVNGEKSKIYGNGGWGYGPRTAIGQRKDGIILMLVIDGRRTNSVGASIKDIQDIMSNYGAYNAANLDGGSSTTLVVNNKVMNNPVASTPSGMRRIPNAFIVKE